MSRDRRRGDTINFKVHFECKCGEYETDRFLFEKHEEDEHRVYLLCLHCERRYLMKLLTREIR